MALFPPPKWLLLVLVVVVVSVSEGLVVVQAQQAYVNNRQLDCYNQAFNSITKGFVCNGARSSCPSYITFRSLSPYNSPVDIAYLLGLQSSAAPLIASINNISSDTASIPDNTLVVVPVDCSCFARQYYQHNASYTLKVTGETYFTVANLTYQGLSTCQALMAQNPYGDRNLTVGLRLQVPLRCACPTSNQTALGAKYLLTYMIASGDSISAIGQLFGVQEQTLLDANQLSSSTTIFPFTPILVPLTTEPTKIDPSAFSPPAAAAPPQTPIIPAGGSSSPSSSRSQRHWIYVGVAVGVIFVVTGFLLWWCCNRKPPKPASTSMITKTTTSNPVPAPFADSGNSWSLSSHAIRGAVESLTVYRMEDLQEATANFSQANRIKGSVFRGYFKGDTAAVKVLKGDVSAEINMLKMINHFNIIRLSGFCLHQGNTYLVYEYAESGSLSDYLHSFSNDKHKTHTLPWKQRVQIAHDVADALNYLHNYSNPPYIHKNLKTSNILLDANLRAKIANFGLARMLETYDDGNGNGNGGLQLTRHVVGTQGYLAPEYIENGLMTPKLDVFAFGVVLLELLSGKEAVAETNQLLHTTISHVLEGDNVREKLHAFLDPRLEEEYPLDLAFSTAQLAHTCVAQDLNARPAVSQVLVTLSKILSSSLDWDPSNELGRSRSLTHSIGT